MGLFKKKICQHNIFSENVGDSVVTRVSSCNLVPGDGGTEGAEWSEVNDRCTRKQNTRCSKKILESLNCCLYVNHLTVYSSSDVRGNEGPV